jgi:hypothetical protein
MADDGLKEMLFGRQPLLKVFVSSQMRGPRIREERRAAVDAIEATGLATAWHWERDARAGPYSARDVCIEHAATSDGLVLILAGRLTPVTKAEYTAARNASVPRYVLLRQGARRNAAARGFVRQQQKSSITRSFHNTSELKTHISDALKHNAIQSVRREIARRRATQGSA